MADRRAQLLRYLRDCHRADSRDFGLYDIRKKAEHLLYIHGREEILNGLVAWLPVDGDWSRAASAAASLYRREKSLVYGAFYVVGPLPEPMQHVKRVCAPLFLFPARAIPPGGGRSLGNLQVDTSRCRINVPLLAALVRAAEDEAELEELLVQLPGPPLTADSIHGIGATLREATADGIETRELYRYPQMVEPERFDSLAKGRKLRAIPFATAAVVPNPRGTQGVYYELSRMAEGHTVSTPVRALLGEAVPTPPTRPEGVGLTPAVLNPAQSAALRAAARWPISFVVGPPGTGKSYTIAAAALEHVVRGESVLIAARTQQALQVIEEKLAEQMSDDALFVIRGGRDGYSRQLRDWLKQLLQGGIRLETFPAESVDLKRAETDLQTRQLDQLEKQITRQVEKEQLYGRAADRRAPGAVARGVQGLQKRWHGFWARRGSPLWEQIWSYEDLLRERSHNTSWLLRQTIRQRLEFALKHHRRDLKQLNSALRARTSAAQDKFFAGIEFSNLLTTFPIWLVTINDIHKLLPLEQELFDVALIDEATQCDMAAPLPIAQRARRLVISGDPRQLRHVSFLSRDRRRVIAEQHGLRAAEADAFDYRERAFLDLVDERIVEQAQIQFLDEHYRSQPHLIEFSNREFYRGALRIMTRHPHRMTERPIELVRTPGRREPGGVNAVEVEQLVTRLTALVEQERDLPDAECSSIGVLSPLRDQVDALAREIGRRLPLRAIQRHGILTGTSYSFQGEERDIMLLSFAVDDDAHPTALRYVNRPDVFNVAVTRARARQIVFVSRTQLDPDTLLARYLQTARQPAPPAVAADTDLGHFLDAVQGALEQRDFRAWPAWRLAGMVVDLVAEREGQAIGVDLVGAGPLAPVFPLDRYRMLDRAGLPVFALPYSAWTRDPQACLTHLERQWSRARHD